MQVTTEYAEVAIDLRNYEHGTGMNIEIPVRKGILQATLHDVFISGRPFNIDSSNDRIFLIDTLLVEYVIIIEHGCWTMTEICERITEAIQGAGLLSVIFQYNTTTSMVEVAGSNEIIYIDTPTTTGLTSRILMKMLGVPDSFATLTLAAVIPPQPIPGAHKAGLYTGLDLMYILFEPLSNQAQYHDTHERDVVAKLPIRFTEDITVWNVTNGTPYTYSFFGGVKYRGSGKLQLIKKNIAYNIRTHLEWQEGSWAILSWILQVK